MQIMRNAHQWNPARVHCTGKQKVKKDLFQKVKIEIAKITCE